MNMTLTEEDNQYLKINEMTVEEKLVYASSQKEQGTTLFKDGSFKAAHKKYLQGLKFVVSAAQSEDVTVGQVDTIRPTMDVGDAKVRINELKCVLYLNIAACHQKNDKDLKREQRIISCCSKVLALDHCVPGVEDRNVKALYRRARAWADLGEVAAARDDLRTALKMQPENKALKTELAKIIKREKEYKTLMSKRMASLFV